MDYSNRFVDSLADDFNLGVEVRDVVKEDMILVQFSSDAPNASLRYWTTIDEASKAKLDYVTSNGLVLETTPNKATTVLRTYKSDTGAILDELGNIKSLDFGPRDGVFKNISKQN